MERLYRRLHYGAFLFPDALSYYFKNPNGISKTRSIKGKWSRLRSFWRNENIAQDKYPDLYKHCHKRTLRLAKSIYFWKNALSGLNKEEEAKLALYIRKNWKDYSFGRHVYLLISHYYPKLCKIMAKLFR